MNRTRLKGLLSAIGMMVLILDTKTALVSAAEGITLCIYTVIPSLFPFIFISYQLTNTLTGMSIPLLRPINRLCGMAEGSESYFLIGLLGGYPTGAACISKGYIDGQLSRNEAEHMLGFCSNAGPAFLFGMAGQLFTSSSIPWLLWGVHITSAILSGYMIKSNTYKKTCVSTSSQLKQSLPLQHALSVTATICGWVVLFRIVVGFCSKWFLWLFSSEIQSLLIGVLELSNGCCSLSAVSSETAKFILLSCFLAFGGICVTMQTVSVAGALSLRRYFLGKILQTLLSLLIDLVILPFTTLDSQISIATSLIALSILAVFLLIPPLISKITVAFPSGVRYNVQKL